MCSAVPIPSVSGSRSTSEPSRLGTILDQGTSISDGQRRSVEESSSDDGMALLNREQAQQVRGSAWVGRARHSTGSKRQSSKSRQAHHKTKHESTRAQAHERLLCQKQRFVLARKKVRKEEERLRLRIGRGSPLPGAPPSSSVCRGLWRLSRRRAPDTRRQSSEEEGERGFGSGRLQGLGRCPYRQGKEEVRREAPLEGQK